MIVQFVRRLLGAKPRRRDGARLTATAEPGFYPPHSDDEATRMEKIICMRAFGDPKKLELLRQIAWHDLFNLGVPAGTDTERQAVREAYAWYAATR